MSQALWPSATVFQAGRPSLTLAKPSRTPNSGYRLNLAHRVAKRPAPKTRRVSSPPLMSPSERLGYSSDEDIKPELVAEQIAEVNQSSDSEMGDNMKADDASSNGGLEDDETANEQMGAPEIEHDKSTDEDPLSDSEMEENTTVGDGSSYGELETDEAADEQMGATVFEDDNSTDEDSLSDVSVNPETSDDEELKGDPVTTDAWSLYPSRKTILRLARLRDQQNEPFNADMPPHTAQDVTIAALHSVRFLQSLRNGPVDPNRIGINCVGHPFLAQPLDDSNFRKDFSDMVAELEKNTSMSLQKETMNRTLVEYLKVGDKLDGIHDGMAAVHALLNLVKDTLGDLRFEIVELQQVQNECNKVMREMNRIISAVNAVKQDLADTGSTSLKRWNELRRMVGWASMAASRGGNEISPNDVANVIRDFELYLKPYLRLLGMTVHLDDGLNEAIASLRGSSV